jgi:hypothetical protein
VRATPPRRTEAAPNHNHAAAFVFLISAAHDDLDCVVQQRTLQRLRFVPRRAHPDIALFRRGQNDGHRLRMNGFDNGIGSRCQKPVDQMRTRHRFGFRTEVALEGSSDSGKGEQGPAFVECEPHGRRISFGRISEKLEAGARQRLAGLSQPRQ